MENMNIFFRFKSYQRYILISLLLLGYVCTYAANKVGVVISSSGSVKAVDQQNQSRMLSRRSPIFSGDNIKTAKDSAVKFRFTDSSIMTLSENSDYKINQYQFDNANPQNGKLDAILYIGGLKTVTGFIPYDNYKVSSPITTVGIRGTVWGMVTLSDGTSYIRIFEGTINVTSNITGKTVSMSFASGAKAANYLQVTRAGKIVSLTTMPPELSVIEQAVQQTGSTDSINTIDAAINGNNGGAKKFMKVFISPGNENATTVGNNANPINASLRSGG